MTIFTDEIKMIGEAASELDLFVQQRKKSCCNLKNCFENIDRYSMSECRRENLTLEYYFCNILTYHSPDITLNKKIIVEATQK